MNDSPRPLAAWRAAAGAALAGALLAAAPAHASEVSLLAGSFDGYHNLTAAWQSDALWAHDFGSDRLDFSVEASAGRVFGPAGKPGAPLWHVGLTPFLRWWFTQDTAVEAGIGANFFSGTYIGSKTISTSYQFGDSLGLFHRIQGSPWGVGLRFTHYSNADIKRPNPGQNYLQLRLSYELR
ncbi:MAG: acyloxyacyl hydrolase [Betaproteobacteria bacterium]|nr:acyloxyacyl hydrolase [Betaproteobacteria bacterium]MBU6511224.1 acyloxyacyl hydrolase [Betaproteobacteria bacterium]MDE1955917.1 acyloxyacyl hydrolase [Betaproteobacteria bacterium]MDE2151554.1 acyloxyacyl hydrolase [Betaproteobacteria bacterium]MDE2478650.1 acyloxyacyl hydrolase [Betaproteobacteria bacterium]